MEEHSLEAAARFTRAEKLLQRIQAQWERSRHTLDYLLAKELTASRLEPPEKAQITERAANWARRRGSARYLLEQKLTRRLDSLPPPLRRKLEITVSQLLSEERTPPALLVSGAVEEIKRQYGKSLGGMANAVLRSIAQGPLPYPDAESQPAEYLAAFTSHPLWIVQRWLARWGFEHTFELLNWNNRRPAIWLRWNRLLGDLNDARERLADLQIQVQETPDFEGYFRLQSAFYPHAAALVSEGFFTVQDPSASLAVRLLRPRAGMDVLDLSAAPGGKTSLMAELTGNRARLTAVDVSADRVQKMRETFARLRVKNVKAVAADGREFAHRADNAAAYDAVLLDVPCSGFGVLSRRADLRWRRQPEDLPALVALQKELIRAGSRCVKPGGALIYSTCSIEPEENENIVRDFLREHDQFALDKAHCDVPECFVVRPGEVMTDSPRDGIDGVYAARIIRKTSP